MLFIKSSVHAQPGLEDWDLNVRAGASRLTRQVSRPYEATWSAALSDTVSLNPDISGLFRDNFAKCFLAGENAGPEAGAPSGRADMVSGIIRHGVALSGLVRAIPGCFCKMFYVGWRKCRAGGRRSKRVSCGRCPGLRAWDLEFQWSLEVEVWSFGRPCRLVPDNVGSAGQSSPKTQQLVHNQPSTINPRQTEATPAVFQLTKPVRSAMGKNCEWPIECPTSAAKRAAAAPRGSRVLSCSGEFPKPHCRTRRWGFCFVCQMKTPPP